MKKFKTLFVLTLLFASPLFFSFYGTASARNTIVDGMPEVGHTIDPLAQEKPYYPVVIYETSDDNDKKIVYVYYDNLTCYSNGKKIFDKDIHVLRVSTNYWRVRNTMKEVFIVSGDCVLTRNSMATHWNLLLKDEVQQLKDKIKNGK